VSKKMTDSEEQQTGHDIIEKFFDLQVFGKGSGHRYVSLRHTEFTVEERDMIVKAIRNWISR
jgi:hypothetical protein